MLSAVFFTQCGFVESGSERVMFLEVPEIVFETNSEQGLPSHNITDVWAYADGQLLGVFPLPARIPILFDESQEKEIRLSAGIRNNGVKESAFIYRLMDSDIFTLPYEEGKVTTYVPTFRYVNDAKFDLVEGFEFGNQFLYPGLNNDGGQLSVIEGGYESEKAGSISVSEQVPVAEIGTLFTFDASKQKGDTYIELDYKNDIPFFVGVYKTEGTKTTQIYNVLIAEKEDWNHIYIDLTLDLQSEDIQNYRAMILLAKGDDNDGGTVIVDNIKLVHL